MHKNGTSDKIFNFYAFKPNFINKEETNKLCFWVENMLPAFDVSFPLVWDTFSVLTY